MKKLYILLCALAITVHTHSNDYRKKTYNRRTPNKVGYQQQPAHSKPVQQPNANALAQLPVLQNQACVILLYMITLKIEADSLKQ